MKKLLIGCGVTCLVIILLMVVAGVASYQWVKKQVPHMHEVEQARTALLERFGPRDAFVPDLDGALRPERVQLFLAVRESLLTTRAEIGGRLEGFVGKTGKHFEGRNFFQKIIEGMSMAKGGVGLFGQATEYIGTRAQRLMASEMGEGEYTYLFCLLSYCWLEWDPSKEFDPDWFASHDMKDAVDEFTTQHRRVFVKQLRNLRDKLEEKTPRTSEEEKNLERVRQALQETRGDAFPFQGAMPAPWVAVLDPFRQRFQATLPRSPGEYILESVEQLIDEEEKRGVRIHMD